MNRLLAGVLLVSLATSAGAQLSNLVVVVQNAASGIAIPGATVAALTFQNGQPQASLSAVGTTDATGVVRFNGAGLNPGTAALLTTGYTYVVVAATQGYLPSLVGQYGNNPPTVTPGAASVSPTTVTVSVSLAAGVGEIDANVSGATPNSLVFGQVGLQAGGGAAAFGVAHTDGSGSAVLQFLDVAFASAPTYNASGFDPVSNISVQAPVNQNLNSLTSPLSGAATPLNFSNGAPPVQNINQSQSNGSLNVLGVVTDTTPAAVAIPGAQIGITGQYTDQYGQNRQTNLFLTTDQNGVFQLYGLTLGVTYYTTIYPTCNPATGTCYQGSPSTAVVSGYGSPPGQYDFLYQSTVTSQMRIKLPAGSPSSGVIAVYVTDQFGHALPQTNVSVFGDNSPWRTGGGGSCGGGGMINNPGLAQSNTTITTTYALVTGLPSGDYEISAFTPYGQSSYNAGGGTTTFANSSCSPGSPSLRVTIDTTTVPPAPDVYVYDVFGNLVANVSSVTIQVAVTTSATGALSGALTFPTLTGPTVDLSSYPISISLSHNCFNCAPGGGFTILGSTAQSTNSTYTVPAASGVVYQLNVQSQYWAPIFPGGGSNSNNISVDLTQSSSATLNIQFSPGGRVVGHLHRPDGSVFVPANNQFVSVNLNGNGGGGSGGQVANDGSFIVSGVLPGIYTANVFGGSNNGANIPFPYTTPQPPTPITVTANVDTQYDVYLANAIEVQPKVTVAALPPLNIFSACNGNNSGDCPPETFGVFAFPQGSIFTTPVVGNLINNGSSGFQYSVVVGTNTVCYQGGYLTSPGFCAAPLTVGGASGSAYDFYLMRLGSFDSNNYAADARPYFAIESSSKNVVVSQAGVTASADQVVTTQGSTITVQDIVLTPSPSLAGLQQAVLAGTVTISNLITSRQFTALGGNFNNFINYLPIAWVYDSSGALKAFGAAVPAPIGFTNGVNNSMKAAVASNNYSQFLNILASVGSPGYEIRGLTAGQTYSLVLTTPNYPPYQTTVTLGAAQSTTTVNVDFDLNPGSNLTGVVLSTSSKVIPGASVTIQAAGYPSTTLTTDTSGSWQLNGLAAGQYQILAAAAGYAQQAQNVSVSGSGSVLVPAFTLARSNASISGTVYTNNPICPAGAVCSAFGKTVLQGAVVLAYDDTVNVINPSAVLPLYRGIANSSGAYEIDGLQTGDIYKVFAQAPGYYVLNQTTLTITGQVAGFDFAMQPKPLDVNVFGSPVSPNYQFQITNYQQFSAGHAWVGPSPFVKSVSTDVSSSFYQQPDSQGNPQILLNYPLANLTTGVVYVFHVEAQPNNPNAPLVIKEVQFGLALPNNTCQAIDSALVGDSASTNAQGVPSNQAPLDISGANGSGLSLPAGGVIPMQSTSVPSMCMTNTDASVSPQAAVLKSTGAFASGVYQVTLSSVNYTAKGFNLTFAYNQNSAALNDLAVYTFNSSLNEWQSVPGLQTLNPVQGTISVNGLKNLASVLSAEAASTTGGGSRFMALSDGRSYRPAATPILTDDTGLFAVLRPSQLSAGTFSGSTLVVYNFPNPFNLQNKTVSLNSTATNACTGLTSPQVTTNGTVIKFEVPAGMNGHGEIRIYTLSGRLVRELDQGTVNGGTCTYTSWDGTNRNGLPVANGVYYGILTVGGSKASSGTFKMAVIK